MFSVDVHPGKWVREILSRCQSWRKGGTGKAKFLYHVSKSSTLQERVGRNASNTAYFKTGLDFPEVWHTFGCIDLGLYHIKLLWRTELV